MYFYIYIDIPINVYIHNTNSLLRSLHIYLMCSTSTAELVQWLI